MLLVCLHREAAQGGLSLRASSARHRHYYHTPATHIRLADPSIKGAKKKGLTVSSPSQTSHFAASKTSTARKAMIGYGAAQSSAFATLCERYRQQLSRAAHRITRSREDAEDAVQDALLNAFVHIGEFDGRSSLPTWLTRIAIKSAPMILRKNRGAPEITLEGDDDFTRDGLHNEMLDRAPNPESRYAQREAQRIARKAVQRLRPTLRTVVHIFNCRNARCGRPQKQQASQRDRNSTTEVIIRQISHMYDAVTLHAKLANRFLKNARVGLLNSYV